MATIKNLFLLPLLAATAAAAAPSPDWCLVGNPGVAAKLQSISPEAFALHLERVAAGKTTTTAVRNINRQMPSQYRLSFRVRGQNDRTLAVIPLLALRENDKTVLKFGTRVTVRGTQWQNCRFSLDSAFQLGDALFDVRQLKFAVNIDSFAVGDKGGVEIDGIKLHAAADGESAIVVKLPPDPPAPPGRMKIYFHFDNDDFATVARNRKRPAIADPNPDAGFRSRLLQSVADRAEVSLDPAQADLIVYASCSPAPQIADRIAAQVRNGTPLLACGEVADPAIAALLPVTLTDKTSSRFPERRAVRFVDFAHPLAQGLPLNTATFGIYRDLAPREGKTLLAFDDGSPAVVEGVAGRGRVIYSTFAPGADLLPDGAGRDGFLLRMAGYLTGKPFPELRRAVIAADADGWRPGASRENFGRFGYLVGDGLLTELLRGDLSVANDYAEYAFSARSARKRLLSHWRFREDADTPFRKQSWNAKWLKIGAVELETDCIVPTEWQGSEIQFVTASGIDDLAAVYCNGQLIGKVDKSVPEYWQAPHRYTIPANLIRFGAANRIRVVSENLRGEGGFNSCPELAVLERRGPASVAIDRINWLGKGGVLTEDGGARRRFDTSLAFPGIRWDLAGKSVDFALRNIARYAAYSTATGIVTVDLEQTETIPTDTWNAPWLLLFGNEYPLMPVFEHRPEKIEVLKDETGVTGLRITAPGDSVGVIVPVWLFGKQPMKTAEFTPALEAQVRFWYPKALCFPVGCDEQFRLLPERVEIRNRFHYRTTVDDWRTAVNPYAPVPQLAWLMRDQLFQGELVEEWPLHTLLGPYAARPESDTVTWSLPLPPGTDGILPEHPLPEHFRQQANTLFSAGNHWSAGGKVRVADWTPEYPMGRDYPECRNLSMHAWAMGLNQAWLAPWILTEQNRQALIERTRIRFIEPIERFAHKTATRYREEPFSRIAYPIYFNSFYRNEIRYEGRPVSGLNYGDQNETAMMIFAIARKLADQAGQQDLVRGNWNFFREAARLPLVSDDWGHLSCHCRETGEAATIDMLNCEYPAMISLARLAEIAGDEEMRAQALYRAARRMVPVLARLRIRDYAVRQNLVKAPEMQGVALGFDEEGAVFRKKHTPFRAVELFDMSQGTEPDLVALYRRYATEAIRSQYLDGLQQKLLGGSAPELTYELLAAVALLGTLPADRQQQLYERLFADAPYNRVLGGDWPGISIGAYLAAFQASVKSEGAVK